MIFAGNARIKSCAMPEIQVKDVRKQEKTRAKAWISAGNARIKSCAMPEMQVKDMRKQQKICGKV